MGLPSPNDLYRLFTRRLCEICPTDLRNLGCDHLHCGFVGTPVLVAHRLSIRPGELRVSLLKLTRNLVAFLRRGEEKKKKKLSRCTKHFQYEVAEWDFHGAALTSVDKPIQRSKCDSSSVAVTYCSSSAERMDTRSPPSTTQSCLASDQLFLVSAFSL